MYQNTSNSLTDRSIVMEESKHFHLPKIGMRVVKTLLSVLLVTVTYDYLLGGRNACFACIGAVYALSLIHI